MSVSRRTLARSGSALAAGVVVVAGLSAAQPAAGTTPPQLAPASTTPPGGAGLAARALHRVSASQHIPMSRLEVSERTTAHLPNTGVRTVDFKVAARDGRLFAVSFDEATGRRVTPRAVLKAETTARSQAQGKLDTALVERFAQRAGAAPVALWVPVDAPPDLGRRDGGVERLGALIRTAQRPLVRAMRRDGVLARPLTGVPAVFAHLTESQVMALQGRHDVSAVNLVSGDLSVMTDDSATSDHYPYVWGQANGTGGKVAVHEDDGVDNVNTWLNNATHPVTYWNPDSPDIGTEGGHATHVAGVMASTHPWRRGGSYHVNQILSANFNSFGDPVAMTASAIWAVQQGADAVNMSWGGCSSGGQTFESRWVDYMQKAYPSNFVVSSGNIPNCGGSTYVATPSLGWNTLSVGSFWDHNTGLHSDDTESGFTEWQNPTDPNSGRTYEKPDVTAHGGDVINGVCRGVETTEVGGTVSASTCGTSFAAPDVSALVADVKQKIGHGSPEAAKAIVMAGATHNIVDGLNLSSCPASPIAGDCMDGAGGIDARQTILNVANPGNYSQRLITSSNSPAGTVIDLPTTFIAGRAARAVIAWDSTATCSSLGVPGGSCSGDVLNADLDLQVLDPQGNVVASSSSFQNSTEVVDFTPTVTGTYTVRTRVFRFDASTSTFLGIAWNADTVDPVTPLTGSTPFTLNTTKANQTTDQGHSFWDSYHARSGGLASCNSLLSSETGLEKVYRITTGRTGKISATLSNIVAYPGVGKDLDVILLKGGGDPDLLNRQLVTCGETSFSKSQPAGTYYVVVDGARGGSVAKYSLRVTLT